MRRAGAVVLRFNYRGVNLSEGSYDEGVGEIEDARAALAFLRGRYPDLPFSLAGFSFGSRIILRLGCEIPGARQLLAVGFPAAMPKSTGLGDCTVPRVFIVSRNDEFCPIVAMQEHYAALPEPKQLIWVEASDHFFAGALDKLEDAVLRVAQEAPPLRSLHAIWSINAGKLSQFERLTNEVILYSLEPGQPGSLKARPDGTLLDGHHRVEVLRARGINVDALPREIVHESNLEGE